MKLVYFCTKYVVVVGRKTNFNLYIGCPQKFLFDLAISGLSLLYSFPLLLLFLIPHTTNRTKHHQGFLNYSIFQKMTPPYRPLKRPKSEPVFFWKWQLWPLRPIRLWPPLVMALCFLPWGANVWTQSVIIIVVVPKLGSFFRHLD